jgi:hypothetical protein
MASATARTKSAHARTPRTSHDFRDRADECERLAAKHDNSAVREDLLGVAATWRRLADEDEQRPKPAKRTSNSRTSV